ncbi:hypothetical protein B0F86_00580 [Pseudomonas syringae]|nr:hypothetical protein B0F86_00580 [Pseudomonas syringae]
MGAGDVVVRSDTAGEESAAGVDRGFGKGKEETRGEDHRTDFFVTKRLLDGGGRPKKKHDSREKKNALYG